MIKLTLHAGRGLAVYVNPAEISTMVRERGGMSTYGPYTRVVMKNGSVVRVEDTPEQVMRRRE